MLNQFIVIFMKFVFLHKRLDGLFFWFFFYRTFPFILLELSLKVYHFESRLSKLYVLLFVVFCTDNCVFVFAWLFLFAVLINGSLSRTDCLGALNFRNWLANSLQPCFVLSFFVESFCFFCNVCLCLCQLILIHFVILTLTGSDSLGAVGSHLFGWRFNVLLIFIKSKLDMVGWFSALFLVINSISPLGAAPLWRILLIRSRWRPLINSNPS